MTFIQETKGGLSSRKIGYADINLAEFAGSKHVSHCYLLDGYNSKSRQDNSLLKVTVDMTQRSGDFLFKVLVQRYCILICPILCSEYGSHKSFLN